MSFYPCCICLYECFYFLHMPFFSMFVGMSMTSKEIFGSIVGYLEPLSSCEEPAIVKKIKKINQNNYLSQTHTNKLQNLGSRGQMGATILYHVFH